MGGLFSYYLYILPLLEAFSSAKPVTKIIFMCTVVAMVVACYYITNKQANDLSGLLREKIDKYFDEKSKEQMRTVNDLEDRFKLRERKIMESYDYLNDSIKAINLKIDRRQDK